MRLNPCYFLAAACLLAAAGPAWAVQIVAHRGASWDAPENTLASFKLGYDQKADGDELDIWLTADGKVLVCHDGATGRTTGVTNTIAATGLEQLRRLEAGQWGKWRGSQFKEKLPLLEEVLPLVPAGKRLFIEIKCGPEVLPELERVLKQAGKQPGQIVLIGFGYETVREAKARFRDLEVCWLVSPDKKDKTKPTLEEMIEKAKAAGLDGLDLDFHFPIDQAFVRKVHGAGLKLYTWTVDDPQVAGKHAAAGVDGTTPNRPLWLREQLASGPKE